MQIGKLSCFLFQAVAICLCEHSQELDPALQFLHDRETAAGHAEGEAALRMPRV